MFIIKKNFFIDEYSVIQWVKDWSEEKAERFDNKKILNTINSLEKAGFIEKTLCGYKIAQ